jgi:hypothetical protein
MLNVLRKMKDRINRVREEKEKRTLGPLYSPDPSNLDLSQHCLAAIEWLKRAQDAGTDRGVSWGTRLGSDFEPSYPETTGYICQTFVDQSELTGESDLIERAIEMGDWEIAVQMPEGAVMGGQFNTKPTPAVFNTGMVLLGWSALIRNTGEERFKQAARRAGDWLLSVQEPNGEWMRGNSQFADAGSTLYNVKAAWGLCEAGVALGDERYVQAAVRNADFCVAKQHPNGWFPDCALGNAMWPLLHTLAYTMQGLVGISKLTDRLDFLEAARRTADAEGRIMGEDGFLPGAQNSKFRGGDEFCCLTGSAQTSIVWSELFLTTGENKYRQWARRVNRYLMAHHDIVNVDPRLRGGLPGSWPLWGPYGSFQILNWGTKFLVDALSLEERIAAK